MPGDGLARVRGLLRASLGAKLVLILSGVGLLGSAAITVLLALVITPSFDRLEGGAVTGHVDRTRAALTDYAAKVENAVRDYGDWTASYDYMAHPTRAFEQESFSTLAMQNLGVQGMAYVGNDGHVVIARWIDPASKRDVAAMRATLLAQIGRLDLERVLAHASSASFYLRLDNRLAAVAVAQVRRSDGSGDPHGYVLMARTLGSAQLSNLLQLKASIDLTHAQPQVTAVPRAARIAIAVPVLGPDGQPVATAAFSVPRDLSTLGRRMLLLAVTGSVILLLVVLLVLRRAIARLVLRPLDRLEAHMGVVSTSGSLSLLTDRPRADEIGSLVTSFNAMLRQLKDLREQLEVQSFKLGQSESAVAVMHNVRNALNPISTILSQGMLPPAAVDRTTLDRALAELAGDGIPAARRQKLVAFVAAALEAEGQARSQRHEQLEIGRQALANVLEIIGKQQEQAHARPPVDPCDVSQIVAQNATIARYSGGTSIAFSFPSHAHWALANRVILSQVIGNLFANAAEAIAATGRDGGTIAVTVQDKGDSVEIVIRDDGEGFDPAAAPTLFQRGFSTRAHKSGGLGLHWCANAMGAMGGKLQLVSDGVGSGARAVLTLPAADVGLVAEAA